MVFEKLVFYSVKRGWTAGRPNRCRLLTSRMDFATNLPPLSLMILMVDDRRAAAFDKVKLHYSESLKAQHLALLVPFRNERNPF